MQIPDPTIESLLERHPIARLATSAQDGRPHQVPIVFAPVFGTGGGWKLWSPVDGKPKSGRELARVSNIRRRPQVSLLLDDYDADWSRLWWLRVDANARVVAPADPEADAEVAAAVDALRAKYPQYESIPMLRDPPTLIELAPVSIRSWCASERAVPR